MIRNHYDDPRFWAVLVVLAALLVVLDDGGLLAVAILAFTAVALCGSVLKARAEVRS